MIRLWVLSDLHLEAVPFPDGYDPIRPEFDVLVAAGDLWRGEPEKAVATLNRLAGSRPAVFVAGNHEAWGMTPDQAQKRLRQATVGTTVHLLDGTEVVLAGIRFTGLTLWADGALAPVPVDPRQITGEGVLRPSGEGFITHGDEAALHHVHRARLEQCLSETSSGLPVVVVTHHAPLAACLPESLRRQSGAGLFASDLSGLMQRFRIAVWIHGHIHTRQEHRHASGTRVLANPAGPLFSVPGFDDALVVEI